MNRISENYLPFLRDRFALLRSSYGIMIQIRLETISFTRLDEIDAYRRCGPVNWSFVRYRPVHVYRKHVQAGKKD